MSVFRGRQDKTVRHLAFALAFLAIVIVLGTAGFAFIEGWSLGDALYMTIISMTTTGFAEVHPLSPAGRAIAAVVIIGGIAAVAYVAGRVLQVVVESYLARRGRMTRSIARLRNHVIVCGFGRMGRHVAQDLADAGVQFVILENDPIAGEDLENTGYQFLLMDASTDEALRTAGVDRARGLVAVLSSDADNVYTALTARSLNPGLTIVARGLTDESEAKLRMAGADRVIKPFEIAGRRIVQLITRPAMVEFVDTIATSGQAEITIEEITLAEGSPLSGKRLGDTSIRRDLNVIVVAIRRGPEELIYNPGAGEMFRAGDRVIVIGKAEQVGRLRALLGAAGSHD